MVRQPSDQNQVISEQLQLHVQMKEAHQFPTLNIVKNLQNDILPFQA
jgi:hypothetical protein